MMKTKDELAGFGNITYQYKLNCQSGKINIIFTKWFNLYVTTIQDDKEATIIATKTSEINDLVSRIKLVKDKRADDVLLKLYPDQIDIRRIDDKTTIIIIKDKINVVQITLSNIQLDQVYHYLRQMMIICQSKL